MNTGFKGHRSLLVLPAINMRQCWFQPTDRDAMSHGCLRHSPRPLSLFSNPHRTVPIGPVLCLDQPLWFLRWLQDALQQTPSGNSEEKDLLLLLNPGWYRASLGAIQWGGTGEGEARKNIWVSAFIRVEGWVPRVLCVYSLSANLKHKNRN